MLEPDHDSRLQDMLRNPLRYADDSRIHGYRRTALRTSLGFIGFGVLILVLDILLYAVDLDIGKHFHGTNRATRASDTLILLWYLPIFVGLPYGIFRLLAIKRYIKISARNDLISRDPQLKQLYDTSQAQKAAKFDKFSETFSANLTKLFVVCVALFVCMAIAVCIAALVQPWR